MNNRKIPENSTPILNDILEALSKIRLSSYEFNMIMAIIRKTYGWDKKNDWIAGSQLSKLTNIRQNHCYRTITKLIEKNILLKDQKRIGLNKRINQWLVPKQVLNSGENSLIKEIKRDLVPKQVVPKQVLKDTYLGTQVVPKQVHTKETITKETIQKKEARMSEEKWTAFWNLYPRKENKKKAKEKFMRISSELFDVIMQAVKKQQESRQWKEGFIPHASTWINQERWTDELKEESVDEIYKKIGFDRFAMNSEGRKYFDSDEAFNKYINSKL